MRKYFLLLLFTCFSTSAVFAQPKLPGQWSVIVDGGLSLPASSSMNGTAAEFQSDLQKDYNSKRYPFGDERALSMNWGAALSYRFPTSSWSIIGVQHIYVSYVDNGFAYNSTFAQNASLVDYVSSLGAEYTIGESSETFNAFGRLGLALSFFSGEVNYFDYRTSLTPTFRGGVDIGVGGRWNMSFAPLALELSASYLNANLIGKSYETPATKPPTTLRERALNDGVNTNDPTDESRTIAYLSFGIGLRVWF
jgi:hypothetical protein